MSEADTTKVDWVNDGHRHDWNGPIMCGVCRALRRCVERVLEPTIRGAA